MFDFHNHYTNWKQSGSDFFGLIDAMDKAGVDKTVVFGLPTAFSGNHYVVDTKTDFRLLQQYKKLPEEIRKRIFPFICGINPNNPAAIPYAEDLIQNNKDAIFGIGEIMCRHDKMSINVFGKEVPANTETMMMLTDLASKYQLPLLVHNNIASIDDVEPSYVFEIEQLLGHNRNTKIIWAHSGISKGLNGIPLEVLLKTLARLFDENDNLLVDLSWCVFEYYIDGYEEEWKGIIEEYPERFLLGTDRTGKWRKYCDEVEKYDELVGLLSEEAREEILFRNAERLLIERT